MGSAHALPAFAVRLSCAGRLASLLLPFRLPAVPVRLRVGRLTLSPPSSSRADASAFASQGRGLGIGASTPGLPAAAHCRLCASLPACLSWMAVSACGRAWCVIGARAGRGVLGGLVLVASGVRSWLPCRVDAAGREGRACCLARSVALVLVACPATTVPRRLVAGLLPLGGDRCRWAGVMAGWVIGSFSLELPAEHGGGLGVSFRVRPVLWR